MKTKHYHVLQGLQGLYMPNCNDVFSSKGEAQRYAAELAADARDQEYKVSGSARSGYYTIGEHECIEITECCESDCLTAEGGE